jgi:hypothetical protein
MPPANAANPAWRSPVRGLWGQTSPKFPGRANLDEETRSRLPAPNVLVCLFPSQWPASCRGAHLPPGDSTPMIPQPQFIENGTDHRSSIASKSQTISEHPCTNDLAHAACGGRAQLGGFEDIHPTACLRPRQMAPTRRKPMGKKIFGPAACALDQTSSKFPLPLWLAKRPCSEVLTLWPRLRYNAP